jgi:alpha-galactosidase
MMMDPLVGAVCDPEEVSQMTDEMLVAEAKWLPQYRDEVPKARQRLARAKRRGEYRGTKRWRGAARLPVKTIGQMRKAKAAFRNLAAASDKGGARSSR